MAGGSGGGKMNAEDKVMAAFNDGWTAWKPRRKRLVYVCPNNSNGDAFRVRLETMDRIEEKGLLKVSASDNGEDTYWSL